MSEPVPCPPLPEHSARSREVVAAAREMLDGEGWEAISMRTLADRLGIRAPSLYKHVASKEALRVRLLVEGFREIGEMLHTAVAADPSPGALLRAYRQHVLAHPAMYRLATAGPLPRADLPAGLEEWAGTPFWLVSGDPVRAQALWAFAHGMVVLEIDGRFPPGSPLDETWATGAALTAGPRQASSSR